MKPITKELIDEIHLALDKGLTKGLGVPVEGQMCVEALICFKLGLPHSDQPSCVHKEVIQAKIALNDCLWSSNKTRAEGMRKLAIAQLGSSHFENGLFYNTLKLNSTKRILPYLIGKHFEKTKDQQLLVFKEKFEKLSVLDDDLWKKFYNYYTNYHTNYHYYSYNYYNYYNYNYNTNYYYYYYCFGDEFLLLIADTVLQTLIELKSEGCKWL